MQETIDRLNSTDRARLKPAIGDDMLHDPKPGHSNQKSSAQSVDVQNASSVAAGKAAAIAAPAELILPADLWPPEIESRIKRPAPPNSDPKLPGRSKVSRAADLPSR